MQQIVPENIPFRIKNKHSSLYLTPLDFRASHSPIIQRNLEPFSNQFKWEFVRKTDSANEFFIHNVQNPYAVFDVNGSSKANDTIVLLNLKNGNKNQQFTFLKASDGTYTFKSVHADLYLAIKDSSTNANAELVQVTGSPKMSSHFILEMC